MALLLCLAPPAFADPTHLSLSLGVGHSHSIAGARLELADAHWGVFAAASIGNLYGTRGFAAGTRWTSGDRQGLVLSLHVDLLQTSPIEVLPGNKQTLVVAAATIGYRLRYQRLWAEAAVGPAIYFDSHYVQTDSDSGQYVFQRQIGFGALGGQDNPRWPDLELAIGFEL